MVGYKWVYLHTQHMIHVNEDFDVVNFTKKNYQKIVLRIIIQMAFNMCPDIAVSGKRGVWTSG